MDQCTHCTCRGDLEKCESVDCNHHELWYVIALKDKMALKTSAQQPQGAIPPEQTAPSAAPVG